MLIHHLISRIKLHRSPRHSVLGLGRQPLLLELTQDLIIAVFVIEVEDVAGLESFMPSWFVELLIVELVNIVESHLLVLENFFH